MPSSPQDFSLRRMALPAFGPSLMFGLCEGTILPVLALSARALGASLAVAGLVVALVGLGSLLANIPAAWLATRFGERRAMVGAAGFCLVALVLCLVARSVWLLGLGVFMVGLARAVFMLARQAFLVEAAPLHLRARAMAMLGGVHRVGMFAGPFLGAAFIGWLGLDGAYWAALLVMLATGALSLLVPDLPTRAQAGAAAPQAVPAPAAMVRAHGRVLLTLGVATALVAAIRACRQVVIPLWASHIGLDAASTSLIYGLMGAVDMLLFYPAGRVMDRRGRRAVALPSMLVMGASFCLMPLTGGFASLLAASLLMGVGNGVGAGIVLTIGADASPAAGRTQFLGIWRVITDIGGGGGPLLLSALTAAITLAGGVLVTGGLGFVAAWMFWRWLPAAPANLPAKA
ncbi:MFS transporter [Comamonas sp. NLF-1-9]|uniref:MFS transporter n=1 Tax=Comamonas sp. NLF-1-9 TaxID=2853163 RepID=UPI001C46D113|nr:MFS transporter [Comamonas sp. NLF-1-9]QXL83513.1 MFS transporter [Comamonas sp. NLF-1-9]